MIRDISAGVFSCDYERTGKYAVTDVTDLLHRIGKQANALIKCLKVYDNEKKQDNPFARKKVRTG